VTKQNDVIRRLQADIHQVEKAADESLQRTRTEAEKQEAAERKSSDGKLGILQQDLAEVRAEYANVLANNRNGEQALRKVGGLVKIEIKVDVCIAPHRENLTPKALRCGSHSFTCKHITPAVTS